MNMLRRKKVIYTLQNQASEAIRRSSISRLHKAAKINPSVSFRPQIGRFLGVLSLSGALMACAPTTPTESAAPPSENQRLFIIGQDLDGIRGYLSEDSLPAPDGVTQYVMFFELTNPDMVYGGLGLDETSTPYPMEANWDAGPGNVWTAAHLTDAPVLALGVSMAEQEHPQIEPGALLRVAEGVYDPQIDALARFAQAAPDTRILMRIGYEFEGVWNTGYGDSNAYRAAFQHIVDRLRTHNVSNIEYVWQASASPIDDLIDGGRDPIENWYPGDAYVDWMGVSFFLTPDEEVAAPTDNPPPTGRVLMDEMLDFARARNKPVIVAEASPQGYQLDTLDNRHITAIWDGPSGEGRVEMTADQVWDGWFAPFFDYLNANSDVIEAIAYINTDWDSQPRWGAPYHEGYWGDTRIEANPEISARWSQAIEDWRATSDETE